MQESLDSLHSSLSLPQGWIVELEQDKLTLCRIQQCSASTSSRKQPMVISHCLEIEKDMSWTLFVHGHKVDPDNCSAIRACARSGHVDINQLVVRIDSLNVCAGHPEGRFSEVTKARKGKFRSVSGDLVAFVDDSCPVVLNGEVYTSTIRTVKCEILVNGVKCESCKEYRSTLRAICHRHNAHKPNKSGEVSSHVNYRYLKTPEQRERMSQLKAELDHSKREIIRLRSKIESIQENEGVTVDHCLEQDLKAIMEEKTEEIRGTYPPNSFLRLFRDQQLMAMKNKECRQVRWHPMIIKWCLSLKFLSSRAYGALRSVLTLPSERTLRDYTHWIDSSTGFHADVDKQLMDEAKVKTCPDFQKYVCLLLDEVRIKEDLVYDKHTSQIIGFINLGDVNNQLSRFQRSHTSSDTDGSPLTFHHWQNTCLCSWCEGFSARSNSHMRNFHVVQLLVERFSIDVGMHKEIGSLWFKGMSVD